MHRILCTEAENVMDMMKRLLSFCTIAFFLAGCTTTTSNTTSLNDVEIQSATIKLAEAASTMSNTMSQTAAVQRATTPPLSMKPLPDPTTFGMDALASVDWSGPVGPIVSKIADASNFQLHVFGQPPAVPVLVSVHQTNVPLGYVLRDIDFQSGSKANIVVFPDRRVIELRYGRS
jgi:defect in organelle trafficking protein DotD